MEYNGFRSISEYETECRKHGFTTKRIPFHCGEKECFVLMTSLEHPSPTSVRPWSLLSADERERILDGVDNGCHTNYLGKLASHGFYPVEREVS